MTDNEFLWELRWKIEEYTSKDDLGNRSIKELTEFIEYVYDMICEQVNSD